MVQISTQNNSCSGDENDIKWIQYKSGWTEFVKGKRPLTTVCSLYAKVQSKLQKKNNLYYKVC